MDGCKEHTEHINTLCGQSAETLVLNVMVHVTNDTVFKGSGIRQSQCHRSSLYHLRVF